MGLSDGIARLLGGATARVASSVREHPKLALAGASSAGATVAAALMARRQRAPVVPALPDATVLAMATASSVHNAAKASVIANVREHDEPSRTVALEAVRHAVAEAASSGVDVTSAALGAVDGAIEVAELLHEDRLELARDAAEAARFAGGLVGPVAARRVGGALEPLLRD